MSKVSRTLGALVVALAMGVPAAAVAGAVVQTVQGDVRAAGAALAQGQRVESGTLVSTQAGARVLLRFDDGGRVLLNENTEFRVVDSRFDAAQPRNDRAIFDLLRGAARFVTGTIAGRSQASWQVRTPQATMGVRGTDFMAAVVNPLYVQVSQGAVVVNNAAGTVAFGVGATATVPTSAALAVAIPAAQLPAAVSAAFAQMSTVAMAAAATVPVAGGAAPGAVGAGTGVVGGVAAGTAVFAAGAVAAGVAAAAGGPGATATQHAVTHGK